MGRRREEGRRRQEEGRRRQGEGRRQCERWEVQGGDNETGDEDRQTTGDEDKKSGEDPARGVGKRVRETWMKLREKGKTEVQGERNKIRSEKEIEKGGDVE